MGEAGRALIAFTASVFGLATLSVILSNRAQTSSVIGAFGGALSSVIGAATSPVTGASVPIMGSSSGSGALAGLGNFIDTTSTFL